MLRGAALAELHTDGCATFTPGRMTGYAGHHSRLGLLDLGIAAIWSAGRGGGGGADYSLWWRPVLYVVGV